MISASRLLLAVLFFLPSLSLADALIGRVVKVTDGDTITVLVDHTQYKIRLAGIDAPERRQAFGRFCTKSLASMVAGKVVSVETHKKDRYGRTVGTVTIAGRDVNLEQVRQGCAWHYKRYEGEQSIEDRQLYARAEVDARASRVGLWKDAHPTPPWSFRKEKKATR